MHNFVRNLITEWRRLSLPFDDKTIVVAVSGGADSLSLLLALYELRKLKKLNLRFVIAHFNHDLRGEESEKDTQFVKNMAGEFGFELALGKGVIAKQGNLEQNARLARYEFLTRTAENLCAFAVLTAHTLNDQAETFLINLIRGSGLEGLGGMKTVRVLEREKGRNGEREMLSSKNELNEDENFSQSPILPFTASQMLLVRPLLTWATREMTENFCREKEIEFRYDTMNEDLAFRRVRVRKILLPMLQDFNPKIIETLANTAFLLQEDFAHLENAAQNAASGDAFSLERQYLSLNELKKLMPSKRRYLLREWLKARRGDIRNIDLKHLEAIERLIFSRKSGKTVELPGGDILNKEDGKLSFEKTKVEKSRVAN